MSSFASPLCALVLAGLTIVPAASAQPTFVLTETTLPDLRGHFALAAADYDNDGDFDLLAIRTDANFLEQTTLTPVLYRNDGFDENGVLQFVEVPFPAPSYPTQQLGNDPRGEALSWADYDNDGDMDAIVATPFGTTLYRNDGGVFTAVAVFPRYSEGYASVFDARSIVWADVDNDGDLDLFLPESIDPDDPFLPDSSAVVLYLNDAGTFTPTSDIFPYTRTGLHLSVGDIDGDGDIDILYHDIGWNCSQQAGESEEECVFIFDNDGGTFVMLPLDFPTVRNRGSSDLADFDNDGDLDVLIAATFVDDDTGQWEVGVRLYRNDGGTFTPIALDLDPGNGKSYGEVFAATFADYNNDGNIDVLVSGRTAPPEVEGIAYVFSNNGDGTFTRVAEFSAAQFGPGAIVWADFDGDGSLDYLATGRAFDDDGAFIYTSWLYRNVTPDENNRPTAPEGLQASTTGDRVTLSWDPAEDDHTPPEALTYNLWVQDANGQNIVSPMAGPDGRRLIPEPGSVGQSTTWSLTGLPTGVYTWTVQAIDNAFNGGSFASEGTFAIGTVANEPGAAPAQATLLGTSPNPARGPVRVRFDLRSTAEVGVRVYDVLGREVLVVPTRTIEAGADRALELDGQSLPAGTYLYRLEVTSRGEAEHFTGRMTLFR